MPITAHRWALYAEVIRRETRRLLMRRAPPNIGAPRQPLGAPIRMHPNVRNDFALPREPDHVHRRRVSRRPARSAFQRRLQFPDRRIARTPDRIERDARSGLAAMAFNFKPAVSAIETLRDGRRRLGWPAKAFHLDRPCFRLSAVGSADGFRGFLAGTLRTDLRAPDPATVDHLSRLRAHGDITAALATASNATRI
jgi:hypothetical protein